MFSGSIPALVTPFGADGAFDEAAYRELIEWQIAEGSSALVSCGTTGEAASLHDEVYSVFGNFDAIRNLDWYYFQNVRGKNPGKGPCLYNCKKDPLHAKNVLQDFPDVARQLRGLLEKHLRIETPPLRV